MDSLTEMERRCPADHQTDNRRVTEIDQTDNGTQTDTTCPMVQNLAKLNYILRLICNISVIRQIYPTIFILMWMRLNTIFNMFLLQFFYTILLSSQRILFYRSRSADSKSINFIKINLNLWHIKFCKELMRESVMWKNRECVVVVEGCGVDVVYLIVLV